MSSVDNSEIWRQIPPEEKFALMSRAHARGVATALIIVIVSSTLAVCFRNPWMMWGSMVISPLIFQLAAGKAWRDLRPRMVLEYLAARSAARRYAFAAESKDLSISLIFRGHIEKITEQEDVMEALEDVINDTKEAEVWIALFQDAIVMLSEKKGGAKCEFAALIDDKLHIEGRSLDDAGDYSSNKEVLISSQISRNNPIRRTFKLTSHAPAALVVFEKLALDAKSKSSGHSALGAIGADEAKHIGA